MRLGIEPARFVPRLILALAICFPLWIVVIPAYNRVLATGLSVALPLVGEGGRTAMIWKDYILVSPPRSGTDQGPPKLEGFRGYLNHYNAPLFLALLLATPGLTVLERLMALVPGGFILYVLHLTYMILELKLYPYVREGSVAPGPGWGYRWGAELYIVIVAQLVPIVLWLLFLHYRQRTKRDTLQQPLPRSKARRGAVR